MSNKILNLDLAKDNTFPAIIYGRIGDDRLQTVTVNVTRRSEPVDLTGYTITFEGVTHEGQTQIFDSDNVSTTSAGQKKGTFDYTFPSAAFAVDGKYEQAYFSIVKDGKRDTTGDFEIIVLSNADINAAEAETVITEYNKLVAELQELQKSNIANLQEQQDTYIQSTDKTFAAIQGRITNLQNTIKGFETSVNDTATDVLSTVNQALEELKAGDFYTQLEADARFAKTEDMSAHTENISNPHKVTKTQIGLGNVDNYSTATQSEAEAGTATNKFMTPKTVFQAIAKWVQG
ncbi:MAG: BppU family phage baseplate upper protein, partial [Enterococcus sp.]